MRRVDLQKGIASEVFDLPQSPQAQIRPGDRCASYQRMVQERDHPTPAQIAEKAEWERAFQRQQQAQSDAEESRRLRLSGRTITVALVGCGKTKLDHPAPAKGLVCESALFRAARRFAERCCDEWVILSAGFGVLLPEQVIAPYEKSPQDAASRQRALGRCVTKYLRQHYTGLAVRYIGLAGEEYLSRLGVPVEWPLTVWESAAASGVFSRWLRSVLPRKRKRQRKS